MIQKVITVYLITIVIVRSLLAQAHPEYTLSIAGMPCGAIIEGLPGTDYDDGTFGEPYFTTGRPGRNFEILLGKANSPPRDQQRGQTMGWRWAVGVSGPLLITDVSIRGTITCIEGTEPQCVGGGAFFERTELTGVPWGKGPQTEENHGALSVVVIGTNGSYIPGDGHWIIGRLRVTTTFPEKVGEQFSAQIAFATRRGDDTGEVVPGASYSGVHVTPNSGNPPLALQECDLTFLAVPEIDKFIRCDANDDARLDISDPIWLLNEAFSGGEPTRCPISRDCNNDQAFNLSDAVYALNHLFMGGAEPPAPYPECGSVQNMRIEDCPGASTRCP